MDKCNGPTHDLARSVVAHVFLHALAHTSAKQPPHKGNGRNKEVAVTNFKTHVEADVARIYKGDDGKYQPKIFYESDEFKHIC
jgi:hypothetical protein